MELVEASVQRDERLPEAAGLLVVQRPGGQPAQGLALEQLADELDDHEHELGEPTLQ